MSGGKGDSEIINTAETYDAETDQWEPIVSAMNNARAGFGEWVAIHILVLVCVLTGSIQWYLFTADTIHWDPRNCTVTLIQGGSFVQDCHNWGTRKCLYFGGSIVHITTQLWIILIAYLSLLVELLYVDRIVFTIGHTHVY